MDQEKNTRYFLLSLGDIAEVLLKKKKWIFLGSLFFAFLGGYFTLSRPLIYKSEARFFAASEGEGGSVGGSTSFLSTLVGMNTSNPSAVAIMNSQLILDPLVQKTALQFFLQPEEAKTRSAHIYENLKTAYAHYKKKKRPIFNDFQKPIFCTHIQYSGETPLNGTLSFDSNSDYSIEVEGERFKGKLGVPFATKKFSLTLVKGAENQLAGRSFLFDILPKHRVVQELSKSFQIEADAENANVLKITYAHPNRHFSAYMINELMEQYQSYLKTKSDERSAAQLSYLNRRKKETRKELEADLAELARHALLEAQDDGFLNTHEEGTFLASQFEGLKKRGFEIDLTLDHLQSLLDFPGTPSDMVQSEALFTLSKSLRELQIKKEGLEIALLSKNSSSLTEKNALFEKRMHQFEDLNKSKFEIKELLASNSDEVTLPKALREGEEAFLARQLVEKNLRNRLKSLEVYEKVLQEQIDDPVFSDDSFNGISLETANTLFLNYHAELDAIELEKKKKEDILLKLSNPNFEISSLSSVFDDTVSQEMIRTASQLSLKRSDEKNRTEKERDRLAKLIEVQRGFLIKHLEESQNLLSLKEELIRNKIHALQSLMHALANKEISLLENSYVEQVKGKMDFLSKEKDQIEMRIRDIKLQIAKLPEKKMREVLLDLEQTVSKTMLEDISQLVESKNISHNLELIESRPIDFAVSPLLPDPPNLLLFLIGGTLLGGCFASSLAVAGEFIEGFAVSKDTLSILGFYHLGSLFIEDLRQRLEHLTQENLASLRRSKGFLEGFKTPFVASLILGKGPDYSSYLAQLLEMEDKKVKVISFNGGTFIPERLNSAAFLEGLKRDKETYDVVLLIFSMLPEESAAEVIAKKSEKLLITLTDEKQDELSRLLEICESKKEQVAFFL